MPTLKQIIEKQDSHAGKIFDGVILVFIFLAIIVFSLETLPNLTPLQEKWLHLAEIVIVVVFTVEYILRIWAAENKRRFIFSFFGIIDLLAILPIYLALGIDLKLLRTLRFFKLIRALKLFRYIKAAERLIKAIVMAKEELILFFSMAMMLLFFSAAGIYYFEHDAQPEVFASVFHCLWWAVATLTTVGYGDMFPITTGGKVFTFVILMIGLSIVAVPTGLLAAAMFEVREEESQHKARDDDFLD